MKVRSNVLAFFVNAFFLCFAVSGVAQSLPEIIWSSRAHQAEPGGFASTNSIRFSPDGQRIIAGGKRSVGGAHAGSITIFNAANGAVLKTTPVFIPISEINELAISPDGLRISTAHNSVQCNNEQTSCRYAYVLYESQNLTRISEPPTTFVGSHSVEYSPDGQIVALGDFASYTNLKFLNPSDLSIIRALPGHLIGNRGRTLSVRFSPDGQFLATGGGDNTVKIWRVSDGTLLQTFAFQSDIGEVFSVEYSPDGQYIAATDRATISQVKIWRVSDGALVRTFNNPYFYSIPSHKVTWTPDGRYVVTHFTTGSDGSRIRFWDFQTGELAREYTQPFISPQDANSIQALRFSSDGRTFAFGVDEIVYLARNPFAPTSTFADFDGDGRSDPSVFRGGMWYMQENVNNFVSVQFGLPDDEITPADFDGDGKTDIAVFREGTWYWLNSSNGSFNAGQFGKAGDVPVPADFTGDGRAELAVFRGGVWWTYDLANNQHQAVQFGISTDQAVPADFDGDRKTDYAVFREGVWHHLRSSDNVYRVAQFGLASDTPTVGDYDGDGKADQAVYRGGTWYVLGSTQGFYGAEFGIASDIPTPADYDGDGKTDMAVFRDGVWWMLRSMGGVEIVQFGIENDQPIQAAFIP